MPMTTLHTPSTLITSVKTKLFIADVKEMMKGRFNITLSLAPKSQPDKYNTAAVLCVLLYTYFFPLLAKEYIKAKQKHISPISFSYFGL